MDAESVRLRRWQAVTAATLFAGYAGYYVCRSNLSVAGPLLTGPNGPGLTKGQLGDVASAGIVAYAAGKLVNGPLADSLGGRRLFLLGLFASVGFTLLLPPALGAGAGLGAGVFLPLAVVWVGNRFVQSMGWGGVVQTAGRWFAPGRLATVMGLLSTSFLLGDAFARLVLGAVVRAGADGPGVFRASAAILAVVGVGCLVTLKRRPADLGLPEPPPPPGNLFGTDPGDAPLPLAAVLRPLVGSGTFWLVCLLSVGLTLLKETFNLWNPTFLAEAAGLAPGTAGMASLLFPLAGAGASVGAGWLADRAGGRYGRVVAGSLVLLVGVLVLLAVLPVGRLPAVVPVLLTALAAVFLLAPYTFCAGVLALRLGGQRGGATAAGLIDTAGYLGAAVAGSGVGRLADAFGWNTAFAALAGVAGLTLVVAVVYAARERRGAV